MEQDTKMILTPFLMLASMLMALDPENVIVECEPGRTLRNGSIQWQFNVQGPDVLKHERDIREARPMPTRSDWLEYTQRAFRSRTLLIGRCKELEKNKTTDRVVVFSERG